MSDSVFISIRNGEIVGTPYGPEIPNGQYLHSAPLASAGGSKRGPMKWRTMETVPTDGRLFDAWIVSKHARGGYRMTSCKWGFDDYDFKKESPGVMFHGPDESEPWRYVWKRLEDVNPTHWMPEPEPPAI